MLRSYAAPRKAAQNKGRGTVGAAPSLLVPGGAPGG